MTHGGGPLPSNTKLLALPQHAEFALALSPCHYPQLSGLQWFLLFYLVTLTDDSGSNLITTCPSPQKHLLTHPFLIWLHCSWCLFSSSLCIICSFSGCPVINTFRPGTVPLISRSPKALEITSPLPYVRLHLRPGLDAHLGLWLSQPSHTEENTGRHRGCQLSNRVTGISSRKAPYQTRVDEQARLVTAVVAEKALREIRITIARDRAHCSGPSPQGPKANPRAVLPSKPNRPAQELPF